MRDVCDLQLEGNHFHGLVRHSVGEGGQRVQMVLAAVGMLLIEVLVGMVAIRL